MISVFVITHSNQFQGLLNIHLVIFINVLSAFLKIKQVNFVMLCSLHSNCKLPCEVATSSMTKKRKILKR